MTAVGLTPNIDAEEVRLAYQECNTLSFRCARNFYLSFLILPRPQRRAMTALYAFLRKTDDLGDGPEPIEQKRADLLRWRGTLRSVLAGDDPPERWWLAFRDTVAEFGLDPETLEAVIDGVETDLWKSRYATFADLREYCYRVASTVGLCCVRVWGVEDPESDRLAADRGVAFQLTNILRDLREDEALGRVYLPAEDLAAFGVDIEELGRDRCSPALGRLIAFQADRARGLFESSRPLDAMIPGAGRGVLRSMTSVYRRLLEKIAADPQRVLRERVSVGLGRKLLALATALPQRVAG